VPRAPNLTSITDAQGRSVGVSLTTLGWLEGVSGNNVSVSGTGAPSSTMETSYSYDQLSDAGTPEGYVPWLTGIATAYSGPVGPGGASDTVLIPSNYYTYDYAGQRLSNTITTEQTGAGGAPEFNSQGNQVFNAPRVEALISDN
jgi:hypothetical protein